MKRLPFLLLLIGAPALAQEPECPPGQMLIRKEDKRTVVDSQRTEITYVLSCEPLPEPVRPAWYGWQTLLLDVASIGLVAGSIATRDETATQLGGTLGGAAFVIAPPAVHAAHKNKPAIIRSVLMRLGAPVLGVLAGFLIGGAVRSSDESDAPAIGAAIGAGTGAIFASVFDAAVWARPPGVAQ
jgi:hypothetical protein